MAKLLNDEPDSREMMFTFAPVEVASYSGAEEKSLMASAIASAVAEFYAAQGI